MAEGGRQPFVCRDGDSRTKREVVFLLYRPRRSRFVAAGNIPERIRAYCRRTGQYVPKSKGEILRCIYESLAMKYRYAAEQIEFCTGKEYDTIYIVGGGTKDKLLSSFTASACNKMFPPDLPRPPFSAILLFSFWRRAK